MSLFLQAVVLYIQRSPNSLAGCDRPLRGGGKRRGIKEGKGERGDRKIP